jgi:hypothetical protein
MVFDGVLQAFDIPPDKEKIIFKLDFHFEFYINFM